jgi:hypothetical protein
VVPEDHRGHRWRRRSGTGWSGPPSSMAVCDRINRRAPPCAGRAARIGPLG